MRTLLLCSSVLGLLALDSPDAQAALPERVLWVSQQLGAQFFSVKDEARRRQYFEAEPEKPIEWKQVLRQKPEWYGSAEAVRIAGNVLLFQCLNGGWEKNIDMAARLSPEQQAALELKKAGGKTTIDNGATYTQLQFLAQVGRVRSSAQYRDAFLKGLDFLLKAQYENGGWPQFFPLKKGYYSHVTFNDDAMIGVLNLLRSVAQGEPGFGFVDQERRARCEQAVAKGVECILRCQVIVGGRRTAWCAQHDEKTLAPAWARKFEPPSLSGGESVGIVRFLMGIGKPGPRVVQAIQSAVSWFEKSKISGLQVLEIPAPGTPKGTDTVAVPDTKAPPIWARFYEIGTNRPIFIGRDSVIRYRLADIEYERRNGYSYYVRTPQKLLEQEYPAWQKRMQVLAASHQYRSQSGRWLAWEPDSGRAAGAA